MNDDHDRGRAQDEVMSRLADGRLKRDGRRLEDWLVKTAEKLATAHGIAPLALREFLNSLENSKFINPSSPSFEADHWSIASDLMPWKEARGKLVHFAEQADSLIVSLGDIIEEPVLLSAITHADTDGRLGELIPAIYGLQEIASKAAAIEGKSGHRPHPSWTIDATNLCREFWRKHKNEVPKRYFNAAKKPTKGERVKNKTTEPANAFSRWFCEVMNAVGKFTPSQCETMLRRKQDPGINRSW